MKLDSGSALLKAVAVTVVALLLLIPLAMLQGLVSDRSQQRQQALRSVAQGWGGQQTIGGLMIAVPVSYRSDDGKTITRDWYVLPESSDTFVDVTVQKEPRKLGIYEVPVYISTITVKSHFDMGHELERLPAGEGSWQVHLDGARVIVPLSDPRGLRDVHLSEAQRAYSSLEPARGFPFASLAAPMRSLNAADQRDLELSLTVAGTESLSFLPLARSSRLRMHGNWMHPGFTNGFLPVERQVNATGFNARWQLLYLNRSYGGRWLEGDVSPVELEQSAFGVNLVQPVDLYQQVTRAVKYGGLFIGLSLLTLFLMEFLIGRPLHPIQYGLMGLALAVFYLLLLALAEHIGFALAYALAAAALCALLGVYVAGALRSTRSGIAASGSFAAVYGVLYLLVTSEDYSLLAGALTLFALLATLMVLTRKVDWYTPKPE